VKLASEIKGTVKIQNWNRLRVLEAGLKGAGVPPEEEVEKSMKPPTTFQEVEHLTLGEVEDPIHGEVEDPIHGEVEDQMMQEVAVEAEDHFLQARPNRLQAI